MDSIVHTVKREVSLDSDEGADLERLWSFVKLAQQETIAQQRIDCSDISVDRPFQEYLWPIILRIGGLIFKSKDTVVFDTSVAPEAPQIKKKFDEFASLSLGQVESKYPDLSVRGSAAVINKELYGIDQGNRRISSSAHTERVFKEIARAREKGITQRVLAKRLKIDSRSIFCYIRNLVSEGLIAKFFIYMDGCNTNLVMLQRYKECYLSTENVNDTSKMVRPKNNENRKRDDETEDEDMPAQENERVKSHLFVSMLRARFRSRLYDYIQNLESPFILELDLLDAMDIDIWDRLQRRFFQRSIGKLCEKGYIECVRALFPDPDYVKPTSVSFPNDNSQSADSEYPRQNSQANEAAEVMVGEQEESDSSSELTQEKPPLKRKRINPNIVSTPEGYIYRRCYRILKPLEQRPTAFASVGIPLQQPKQDGKPVDENMAIPVDENDENSDFGETSDANTSSDDEFSQIEDLKEIDEIKYLLSKPQVKFGELACLSMDTQVFRLIALSGLHGTVLRALEPFVASIGFKGVTRIVTRLESMPVFRPDGSIPGIYTTASQREQNKRHLNEKLVTSVEEFFGREHRKRVFANPLAQPLISLLTVDCSRISSDPILPLAELESNALVNRSGSTTTEPQIEEAVVVSENGNVLLDPTTAEPVVDNEALAEDMLEQTYGQVDISPEDHEALNAEYGDVRDVLREAKERKITAVSLLRERVLLRMLEKESIITCTPKRYMKCEEIIRQYALANRKIHAVTWSILKTISNYKVDKSTYIRIVEKLASQKQLWMQSIVPVLRKTSMNMPSVIKIVISREIDPNGPLVEMYIQSLHDERKYHAQVAPNVPRRIEGIIDIPRTEGAEERDRDYNSKNREFISHRVKVASDALMDALQESARMDMRKPKRARVSEEKVFRKRRPVLEIRNTSNASVNEVWPWISKRLDYVPRRIGRLMDLYEHLCENLPEQVDDVYVFKNCGFRSGYLFSYVPLELFMELSTGAMTIPEARYYIRYGSVPADTDLESDSEDRDGLVRAQGTLEEMKARMATPIKDLPSELRMIIDRHTVRARQHIQKLISGLYILQLIRPVATAREITMLPPPPDAKDAFSDITVDNPKLLNFGYQLIGKARILEKEGYFQALKLFELNPSRKVDLTGFYENDEAFDVHNGTGLFQYLRALEDSSREQCYDLPVSHPLYGIALSNYWHRRVVLLTSQAKILDTFVDEAAIKTPLDDTRLLKTAADEAGVTMKEAGRYYQQIFTKLCRAKNRNENEKRRQKRNIRNRIERAKKRAMALEARALRSVANGSTDDGSTLTRKRMNWSDDETKLVAVYFTVLKTHAREHGHPFFIRGMSAVFPSRQHVAHPADSLRQHWFRLQSVPEYSNLGDNLNTVWVYVLRDAVEKGLLVNDPVIDQFDILAAVNHFRDRLESETLDGLLEKYADDIADSGKLFTLKPTNIFNRRGDFSWTKKTSSSSGDRKAKAKAAKSTRAKKSIPLKPPGGHSRLRKARMTFLPDTMKGSEHRYTVHADKTKSQDLPLYEYFEDDYSHGFNRKRGKAMVMHTMLTTHNGWSGMLDYSNPVTTFLCNDQEKESADVMDVDSSGTAETKATVEIVSRAAKNISYYDPLDSLCPIRRTLNVSNITEQLGRLVLRNPTATDVGDANHVSYYTHVFDNNEEHAQIDTQTNTHGDRNSKLYKDNADCLYADVASMQAMIVNLTLTPDDEYDVDTGQELLSAKSHAASQAFNLLSRNQVVFRLRKMASSVGLSNDTTSAHDEAEENAGGSETGEPTATSNESSTVVLHETTGITRVNVHPAASGAGIVRETTMDVDTIVDDEPPVNERDNDKAACPEKDTDKQGSGSLEGQKEYNDERKVPGRGYAIGEQFLSAIRPTLPSSFTSGRQHRLKEHGSTSLGIPLDASEFWHLCQRISAGSLWLRPSYAPNTEKYVSALMGFRRLTEANTVNFDINVVEDNGTDGIDSQRDGHSLDSLDHLQDTEKNSAFSMVDLSVEHIALVSAVVASTVQSMGPLGTTLYELLSLFAILLQDRDSYYNGALSWLPAVVRDVLESNGRLSALLRLLIIDKKLFIVGSSDLRYVSPDSYDNYWSVKLSGSARNVFVPYIGQSFNGSTITKYTFGVMASIVGHIFDSPGISQTTLMRRHFAPYVPKAEVVHYLDMLIALGIIETETLEVGSGSAIAAVPGTDGHLQPREPRVITHYRMARCFIHRISGLGSSFAVTDLAHFNFSTAAKSNFSESVVS
ncbi:hypothetical protein IWW48_001601 [Coemansia sp. RSA 1200]|nr:hypothetical protein IWW48_001601 [Coemansia sp. RSA 1200]